VTAHLNRITRRHPDRALLQTIGRTQEDRPIESLVLSDPTTDPADKQHVLIVAGQHGNEESARLVALRLIDYLLSKSGAALLARQTFVILPNLSPDAAHHDTYTTPAGIKPNLDHAPTGAVSPEAQAFEAVARQWEPELYVDIHARGHAGCSHDMVLFPPSRPYTEDEALLHATARRMAEHGERSGIPHVVHPLTWPGWGGHDLDQPSSTLWTYRQFKSMVFLTENSEHNEIAYPAAQRAKSGVGRLKPLFAMGNARHPGLFYPGYPCGLPVGMFNAGIAAVGTTARARRASRIALWRQASAFERVTPVIPERADEKTLQLHYTGTPIREGAGVQVRVANRRAVRDVRFNGRPLAPSDVDGFVTWHDRHTTFAMAVLPELVAGEHEIVFRFE
jgi:hypothetical protein